MSLLDEPCEDILLNIHRVLKPVSCTCIFYSIYTFLFLIYWEIAALYGTLPPLTVDVHYYALPPAAGRVIHINPMLV